MEKSQDCCSNHIAIMLPVCRLGCPVRVLQILDATTINPQLNLPLDHVFVKGQVCLGREKPPLDVDALYFGMAAMAPDIHPRARLEQTMGLLGRRRCYYVVLVHLVQVHAVVVCAEQLLSHGREVNPRMAELPVLGRCRGDLGT